METETEAKIDTVMDTDHNRHRYTETDTHEHTDTDTHAHTHHSQNTDRDTDPLHTPPLSQTHSPKQTKFQQQAAEECTGSKMTRRFVTTFYIGAGAGMNLLHHCHNACHDSGGVLSCDGSRGGGGIGGGRSTRAAATRIVAGGRILPRPSPSWGRCRRCRRSAHHRVDTLHDGAGVLGNHSGRLV